jgi:hypothetical protein
MKGICLPWPEIPEDERAVVEVKLSGSNRLCRFRIEPLLINDLGGKQNNTDLRINKLRNWIQNYDKQWELIQIFNTNEGSEYVHILYREKYAETTLLTNK